MCPPPPPWPPPASLSPRPPRPPHSPVPPPPPLPPPRQPLPRRRLQACARQACLDVRAYFAIQIHTARVLSCKLTMAATAGDTGKEAASHIGSTNGDEPVI